MVVCWGVYLGVRSGVRSGVLGVVKVVHVGVMWGMRVVVPPHRAGRSPLFPHASKDAVLAHNITLLAKIVTRIHLYCRHGPRGIYTRSDEG